MTWKQKLVNAQSNINCCVWAFNTEYNTKDKVFKDEKEIFEYVLKNAKDAVKELNKAIEIIKSLEEKK